MWMDIEKWKLIEIEDKWIGLKWLEEIDWMWYEWMDWIDRNEWIEGMWDRMDRNELIKWMQDKIDRMNWLDECGIEWIGTNDKGEPR